MLIHLTRKKLTNKNTQTMRATRTELKNRKGELNGKYFYEITFEDGNTHTRTSYRLYVSAGFLQVERNGKLTEISSPCYSGKLLTKDSVLSQEGWTANHFAKAPYHSSAAKAASRVAFDAFKKTCKVTIVTF